MDIVLRCKFYFVLFVQNWKNMMIVFLAIVF